MNNEEKILDSIAALQSTLISMQASINTRLDALEAGQAELSAMVDSQEAKLLRVEAGQTEINSSLKNIGADIQALKSSDEFLVNLAMNIHESAETHYADVRKNNDDLRMSLNVMEQISSKNMFDIAKLKAAANM